MSARFYEVCQICKDHDCAGCDEEDLEDEDIEPEEDDGDDGLSDREASRYFNQR